MNYTLMRVCLLLVCLSWILTCTDGYPNLLFSTTKDIRVANISRPTKSVIIIKDLQAKSAVDFHHAREQICWTNHEQGTIQCIAYNGTHSGAKFDVVSSGLLVPSGLAIDWVTHKVYWTDREMKRLEVVTIKGEHRKVLFWEDIDQPRAIALVPHKGLIFWTDWGEIPKIERSSMDGNNASRTVIVSSQIFWPNGLTVDFQTETLYWIDGRLHFVESMDFSGHNRRVITENGLEYPYALSMYEDMLYWTDWKTFAVHAYNRTANTCCPKEILHGDFVPLDIKVWERKRQPMHDTPCNVKNGGCSHLCLLSENLPGYTCACPTGVRLIDNYTCANGPKEFLLLVQRTDVSRISLDTPDYTNIVLPLTGIKRAMAIDFDPVGKHIYWTDDVTLGIHRANVDGSDQEVIIWDVVYPECVAVDAVGGNLFWTDTGTDRIEVARLNGKSRKVLIYTDLYEPRAIVVSPVRGLMFWSDWYEKMPKIERAAMDGSDRRIIVTEDLMWPNGLALDHERGLVYWCDARTHKIEVVNMDGSDRREVVKDNIPHAYGLTLLGNYLYWTDWQRRTVDKVNRLTGGQRQTIVDQLSNLMGLKAVLANETLGRNPCSFNNGGCSDLCLNRPTDYVCECAIDYELAADRKTCVAPNAFILLTHKENITRISLNSSINNAILPIGGIKNISALDYDRTDRRIYWTDLKLKAMYRAFFNGSEVERIVEYGLDSPGGLAVDWIARNVYWSDTGSKRIEVARLDGHSRKVLLWSDIDEPRSLAIDPQNAFIFWTEWGGAGSLERADLDGNRRTVLISKLVKASGLTLDLDGRRIYWTELHGAQSSIESADLEGNERRTLVPRDPGLPSSLAVYKDQILWTNWNAGNMEGADKKTGRNRVVKHSHIGHVSDILLYETSPHTDVNACSVNNGGCSHLCFALPSDRIGSGPRPATHKCGCPTHFTLNGSTCHAPTSFLIFGQRNILTRLVPAGLDCPDTILPIQGLRNLKALEFDPMTQLVYWIDGRAHSIRSAQEGGGDSTVVMAADANQHLFDLALDPVSGLLFVSCSNADLINVTRIHNGTVPLGVIVKGYEEKPRNLAVHPEKGLLFWTDLSTHQRVMRSQLDGQMKLEIARNVEGLSALTVDRTANRLYWAYNSVIDVAGLKGEDRRILARVDGVHISDLAVHGNFLYWMDRDQQHIQGVNKVTGKERIVILARLTHPNSLISVQKPDPQVIGQHPCRNLTRCSHMCIAVGGLARCACPQGLVLQQDGRTCHLAETPLACGPDHIVCAAGPIPNCIPASWRCDGHTDCNDRSDEINCPQCGPNEVQCSPGSSKCIDRLKWCDGIDHCPNSMDEANCGGVANNWHGDSAVEAEPQKGTYVVSILVGVGVFVVFLGVVFYYIRRFRAGPRIGGVGTDAEDAAHDPLSPTILRGAGNMGHSANHVGMTVIKNGHRVPGSHSGHCSTMGKSGIKGGIDSVRMSAINGSTSGSTSYDRSHITGGSNSSTSGNHAPLLSYPREPLNPPPSPATTSDSTRRYHRSGGASGAESLRSESQYRPYKHYRTAHRPPPPTPCSTDVYDESDYRYDSDPFPPPPTRYHSPSPSCPPSPSSRSSTYFNSLPPPPSPSLSPNGRCDC